MILGQCILTIVTEKQEAHSGDGRHRQTQGPAGHASIFWRHDEE
jgi:hypothetical protein